MDRKRQHCRAVTSFPLMVKGKAWLGIKDPPAGEGQVGQKQHCRAVTSPLPEEEGLGEKVEPSLAKEGRGGSKKQHRRAVTSFPFMVKGKAWLGIKDPPVGEEQVGQKLLFL